MPAATHQWLAQQRVHHGLPAAQALREEVERAGARRVFVTTTRSISGSAFVASLCGVLGARLAGKFDAIPAHSPRESVIAGARALRETQADLVVAIGGGSVIDATKVMLQCVWFGIDAPEGLAAIVMGRHAGGAEPSGWDRDPQSLRMIAVPTTLSAAEFSHSAGVTDVQRGLKQSYRHPLAVPVAVVLDPEATRDTPLELLLSTGMRAMDHAVERWCAAQPQPLADALARQAMTELAQALPAVRADPADADARARCQRAMWLSILPQGSGVPVGASHGIGYILGAAWGVPHGITSCVMLPAVLAWNAPLDRGRQAVVAQTLRGGGSASAAMRAFVRALGLPARLRELGIARDALPAIAARYDGSGPIATNPRPVAGAAQVLEMLELAW